MTSRKRILILERTRRAGALLTGGLLLWLAWAALGGAYVVRAPVSRHNGRETSKIEFRPVPPLQGLLDTMSRREVFRQSVFYETKTTEVVDALGDLVLLGTVQNGDTIRAFIRNTKTQQSSLYSVGETVGDISIKEIRSDCVVVSHGEETLVLK